MPKANKLTLATQVGKWLLGGGIIACLPFINSYIDYRIDQYNAARKGGFRSALAKKLQIEPDEVVSAFSNMYNWTDSVKKFQRETMPTLKKIKSERQIGAFVNLNNERVMYMEPDGSPVRTYTNAYGQYYIDEDGNYQYYLITSKLPPQ